MLAPVQEELSTSSYREKVWGERKKVKKEKSMLKTKPILLHKSQERLT